MRSRWRRRTALLVFALFLAVVPMPVAAAKPVTTAPRERAEQIVAGLAQAGDPAQAFQQLSAEEQQLVRDYLSMERTTITIGRPAAVSNPRNRFASTTGICWEVGVLLVGRNAFGVALWEYNVVLFWCSDGATITYYSGRSRGSVLMPFWQFFGDIAQNTVGSNGYNFVRHFRQGHFALCLTSQFGCVSHSYPWAELTGYADGRHSARGRPY